MFAFAPFGMTPFAMPAASSGSSVVGERIGGDVVAIVNRVTSKAFFGIALAQNVVMQREKVTVLGLDIVQKVRVLPAQTIELAQRVVAALPARLPFSGQSAYDGQDFTFDLSIGGEAFPLCDLFDELTISMGEDEAALLQMFAKPREARGVNVNLYQFINKELRLDVVSSASRVRVFTGLVDACSADDLISGQRIVISATDARERRLNQQTRSFVEKIGYFSPLVFKKPEEYDYQAEEVTDRISTIPYSIEWFEGNPYMTALRPKALPDFEIGPCAVLTANPPALGLSSSERHINAAELTLQIQSQIAYQREMRFEFDSGYSICDYFTHSYPPEVKAIQAAANGAGWMVNDFTFTGLLPNQSVQCWFMKGENHWIASKRRFVDENGQKFVEDMSQLYAHKANWTAAKRFLQPTEERYKVRVQHAGSIAQFGEQKKQYSLSITNELEQIKDEKAVMKWEDWDTYQSPPSSFQAIPGGYARWLNRIEPGIDDAIQCVMAQMSVDILKSHRDACSLEMLFAPQIDLRHTVQISIPNLQLLGKVSAVRHRIDLAKKRGTTELEVKYFANGDGVDQDFKVAPLPVRAQPDFYSRPQIKQKLGTERINLDMPIVEDAATANPDWINYGNAFLMYKAQGNIVREYPNLYRPEVKMYRFDQFIVRTPEIEKESTDTMDISLPTQVFEIGLFNNPVQVML